MNCGTLSSIPGLYALDAGASLSYDNQNVCMHYQISLGWGQNFKPRRTNKIMVFNILVLSVGKLGPREIQLLFCLCQIFLVPRLSSVPCCF